MGDVASSVSMDGSPPQLEMGTHEEHRLEPHNSTEWSANPVLLEDLSAKTASRIKPLQSYDDPRPPVGALASSVSMDG